MLNSSEKKLPNEARIALLLLFLAYALSITDRMILSVVLEPIRLEFGLTDTQMGLVGGLSFAVFYATLGLPIARMADQYQRRLIIICSLVAFSLMTATSGFAVSFVMLFLFRVGVGIGEAGVNPASQSIIADYYPEERRGTAMSILMVGSPVGMIFGYFIGGYVSSMYGWRAAMFAVGFPGLILAVVMYFLLKEPVRGAREQSRLPNASPQSILASLSFMLRTPAIRHLLFAATLAATASYGNSTWLPTFFIRTHGLSPVQVGLIMGLVFGGLSVVGTLAGGKFFDMLSKDGAHRGMKMIAVAKLVTVPLFVTAVLVKSFPLAIGFFVIQTLLSNVFIGPTLALVQTLSPVSMRTVAAAIQMFFLNLIGMGIGPLLVGSISDWVKPDFGERSIAVALACVATVNILSALHFWLCGRAMKKSGN